LPDKGKGRLSNSDPVTGQAAWFDQRVRVERVAPRITGGRGPFRNPEVPARGRRQAQFFDEESGLRIFVENSWEDKR
jgi:hypothetical protein